MAAINFPSNPAVNDIFTAGNRSWKFNGVAWQLQAKSTDNITEGSTNRYFTEARVASAPAVTALESRASDIESAASSLESRVATAESDIDSLQSGLATEVSDRVAAIGTLTSRVANIESNIDPAALDSLTEIVSAFQSADGSLTQTVADLAASAGSNLQAEIDRATAAEGVLANRATALEGRATTAEADIDSLETRATAAEGNISTLQSDLDAVESAASSLTDRVSTAESDIDSLETRASDLENRATSLESTTSDHESRLSSAEGTIAGLGTMATQNSDSVSITGGSISGVTISGSSLEVGNGSATADLYVGQTGNVGIGTEAPTEKLSVVGNISATGTVSAASPTEDSHLTTKSYVDTATTDLSGRIDTEVSDRESAISTLTDRVANIESNIDPAALDSLTEIVSAFQSADSNINGAITNLADAAAANLQAEVNRATAAEQTLTDSIASVVSGLANSVRTTVLDGLSTASNAVITASDSVLSAFGKLQAQVSAVLSSLNAHTADTSNPHSVTKAQVGLGNVDNTSDADKPVSTAQQAALDLKANAVDPQLSGEITLNTNGDNLVIRAGEISSPGFSTLLSFEEGRLSKNGVNVLNWLETFGDFQVYGENLQIKDTLDTSAPAHMDGRRWIDTTDMTEYVSFNGAWVELDRA